MMAFVKRMLGSLRGRKTQLALAVRLAVAAVAAYAIARALHLMLPLWAVLTSLIVTQMSVGRSLKATRDYMLGTVGGAVYGGAIAMLIPHSGEGGLLALLVLAVAPMAFIGAINPSLSAATVTAVIVLLGSGNEPRQSTGFQDRSAVRGHRRRAHRACGLIPGAPIAGGQPDPHQRGAAFGTAGCRIRRTACGPDARARQRRPAPNPGGYRHGDGQPPCDRSGSRAAALRTFSLSMRRCRPMPPKSPRCEARA